MMLMTISSSINVKPGLRRIGKSGGWNQQGRKQSTAVGGEGNALAPRRTRRQRAHPPRRAVQYASFRHSGIGESGPQVAIGLSASNGPTP
jgi:hypothetical protein